MKKYFLVCAMTHLFLCSAMENQSAWPPRRNFLCVPRDGSPSYAVFLHDHFIIAAQMARVVHDQHVTPMHVDQGDGQAHLDYMEPINE